MFLTMIQLAGRDLCSPLWGKTNLILTWVAFVQVKGRPVGTHLVRTVMSSLINNEWAQQLCLTGLPGWLPHLISVGILVIVDFVSWAGTLRSVSRVRLKMRYLSLNYLLESIQRRQCCQREQWLFDTSFRMSSMTLWSFFPSFEHEGSLSGWGQM